MIDTMKFHAALDYVPDDKFLISNNKQVNIWNLDGMVISQSKFKDDSKCFFYKEKSSEACKRFPDNFFDFIYIDADHSYDGVRNDILSWFPKIKIGGFICGHDFDPDLEMPEGNIFGVNKAVTEIFKDKIDKLCLTNESHFKSWFIQK